MHVLEIGIAALRERPQQVERRGRLPVGLELAARIGNARLRGELGAIDDVATIARQLDVALFLDVRRSRLGELSGDAADLGHRLAAGERQYHRHLQEHPEDFADVVGAVLGETFGAIAALQQESAPLGDFGERLLEVARLTCKNQWRKGLQLGFGLLQRGFVRIVRHLDDRQLAPARWRPGSVLLFSGGGHSVVSCTLRQRQPVTRGRSRMDGTMAGADSGSCANGRYIGDVVRHG